MTWNSVHPTPPGAGDPGDRWTGRNRFGKAGSALGSEAARGRYGRDAAAGASGERHMDRALSQDPRLSLHHRWFSLRIPHRPGQEVYFSDVDLALASGNRLVLVDVKKWAAGYTYWSLFGWTMKGSRRFGNKPQSRNMAVAVARYQDQLPGVRVSALVVFVPSNRRGDLPSSVYFLRWPARIRSYLLGDGLKRIATLLGSVEEPTPEIQALVGQMTRR